MTVSEQDAKRIKIAMAMYETYCNTSDEVHHHSWPYLDEEIKQNWIFIATTALEQIRVLAPFQTKAVVEGYRLRGPFVVPKDWSFEDAMRDYFEHGWTQAFDSFEDVPDEASNYHS